MSNGNNQTVDIIYTIQKERIETLDQENKALKEKVAITKVLWSK